MEEGLALLPPRRYPNQHSTALGKHCTLYTNLYDLALKEAFVLEQYTIQTEPEILD